MRASLAALGRTRFALRSLLITPPRLAPRPVGVRVLSTKDGFDFPDLPDARSFNPLGSHTTTEFQKTVAEIGFTPETFGGKWYTPDEASEYFLKKTQAEVEGELSEKLYKPPKAKPAWPLEFRAVTRKPKLRRSELRAAREKGLIPAVLNGGPGDHPQYLWVEEAVVDYHQSLFPFFSVQFDITVDDGAPQRCLPRKLEMTLREKPIHISFLRLVPEWPVKLLVPVIFKGKEACLGVRKGANLKIVRQFVPCKCTSPEQIPESLTYDLTNEDVGKVVMTRDLELPEGVTVDHSDPLVLAVVKKTRRAFAAEMAAKRAAEEAAKKKK